MCNNADHSADAGASVAPLADHAPVARRHFLRRAALGTALGATMGPALAASWRVPSALAATADDFATRGVPRGRFDEPAETPEEVLRLLMEGNARFADGRIMAPHRNMERLKEVSHGQKPQAAFLGCSDSRVPIEIVFDQGFGDIFVVRDAGNVISPEVIASLEFGTLVLGAQVLFVLGHSGCGAVQATLKGDAVPGQISALYSRIQPAVDAAGGDLPTAIANNVRMQAQLLRRSSPVIRELVEKGALRIAGGVYDLASGRVQLLER